MNLSFNPECPFWRDNGKQALATKLDVSVQTLYRAFQTGKPGNNIIAAAVAKSGLPFNELFIVVTDPVALTVDHRTSAYRGRGITELSTNEILGALLTRITKGGNMGDLTELLTGSNVENTGDILSDNNMAKFVMPPEPAIRDLQDDGTPEELDAMNDIYRQVINDTGCTQQTLYRTTGLVITPNFLWSPDRDYIYGSDGVQDPGDVPNKWMMCMTKEPTDKAVQMAFKLTGRDIRKANRSMGFWYISTAWSDAVWAKYGL